MKKRHRIILHFLSLTAGLAIMAPAFSYAGNCGCCMAKEPVGQSVEAVGVDAAAVKPVAQGPVAQGPAVQDLGAGCSAAECRMSEKELAREVCSKVDVTRVTKVAVAADLAMKVTQIKTQLAAPDLSRTERLLQRQALDEAQKQVPMLNVVANMVQSMGPMLIERGIDSVEIELSKEELVYVRNGMNSVPMARYYAAMNQIEEQILQKWVLVSRQDARSNDRLDEIAPLAEAYLKLVTQKDLSPVTGLAPGEIESVKRFLTSIPYKKFVKHSNSRSE